MLGAVVVLVVGSIANLSYQVMRKPSEVFFPLDRALMKPPAETWHEYGALFRQYSTPLVPAELLAALAQAEASGNPVARTYWRWRFAWNPFDIYRPASSAVGMYQMTDAAFAAARRYCIRDHAVVAEDAASCWFNGLYTRILPGDAVELAAIYLDRNLAAILEGEPGLSPTPRQREDLAAMVHLCGAGPAAAYARRGFRLLSGEHCGDQDVAAYLAKIRRLAQEFAAMPD